MAITTKSEAIIEIDLSDETSRIDDLFTLLNWMGERVDPDTDDADRLNTAAFDLTTLDLQGQALDNHAVNYLLPPILDVAKDNGMATKRDGHTVRIEYPNTDPSDTYDGIGPWD